MRSRNYVAPTTGTRSPGLELSTGTQALMMGRLRARTRFSHTITAFKQCAWCGGIEIRKRSFLSGRIPVIGWAFQINLYSWLLLTVGVSHGVCRSCADGIRRQRQESTRKSA